MKKPAQLPLSGLGGVVRFGRTESAKVRSATTKAAMKGRGPLTWSVTVDPGDIIFHQWIPGEPKAWQRVVPAKLKERTDGTPYLRPAFVPRQTRDAEEELATIFMLHRQGGPVEGPVGMRLIVLTASNRSKDKDWDNLGKLISDAGNQVLYVDDSQVVEPTMSIRRGRPKHAVGIDVLVWRIPARNHLPAYNPAEAEGERDTS